MIQLTILVGPYIDSLSLPLRAINWPSESGLFRQICAKVGTKHGDSTAQVEKRPMECPSSACAGLSLWKPLILATETTQSCRVRDDRMIEKERSRIGMDYSILARRLDGSISVKGAWIQLGLGLVPADFASAEYVCRDK